ncbi:hypothetical protein [Variovorax sp. J31P207]|nr:hypothetical protein [Variovorax sp. J31P207]MDM0071806.1 hypothetical protein [Variovorax sp. J31P207]
MRHASRFPQSEWTSLGEGRLVRMFQPDRHAFDERRAGEPPVDGAG